MIKLDDEETAVRSPAAPADIGLSVEDHETLLYGAGAPRRGSVSSSFVIKRKLSLSMMTTGRPSEKLAESRSDEGTTGAEKSVGTV